METRLSEPKWRMFGTRLHVDANKRLIFLKQFKELRFVAVPASRGIMGNGVQSGHYTSHETSF